LQCKPLAGPNELRDVNDEFQVNDPPLIVSLKLSQNGRSR
jgi:hypothetical protein